MPHFLLKDLHVQQNINISTENTLPEVRLIVGIISRAFLLLTRSMETLKSQKVNLPIQDIAITK